MNNYFNKEYYVQHYNCNGYTPEQWESFGERHPFIGIWMITYGTINLLLYLLFIVAMLDHKFRSKFCYKIMFLLGLLDLINLTAGSYGTGYLAYVGAVFCMSPSVNYFTGLSGVSAWCAACVCAMILGLNRCFDWTSTYWTEKVFGGWKANIWIAIPIVYFWWIFLFQYPVFYDPVYVTWYHNPYYNIPGLPYNNEIIAADYAFPTHTINNGIVSVVLTFENVYLCYKIYSLESGLSSSMRLKKNFLIQIISISMVLLSAALVYMLMNFIVFPPTLTLIGTLAYQINSGSPAFIYLIMNKSLRTEALTLIGFGPSSKSSTCVCGRTIVPKTGCSSSAEQRRLSKMVPYTTATEGKRMSYPGNNPQTLNTKF